MARLAISAGGAIIGGIVGGPTGAKVGWLIGSFVGGVVDPMQINGPSLGDQPIQTSRDGLARPIIFGTSTCTGNLIFRSPPKFTKRKTKQPKGGPVSVDERVLYSYAIRICDARAMPVAGVSRIWEDEKLVYDTRPGSVMIPESLKWLANKKIYLGAEDQLPDPTYELYTGSGTTPAFRGTCYMMATDDDRTDAGGRISSYRFEMTSGGSAAPPTPVDMLWNGVSLGIGGGTGLDGWCQVSYWENIAIEAFNGLVASYQGADTNEPIRIIVYAQDGGQQIFNSGWMGNSADNLALQSALDTITFLRYTNQTLGAGGAYVDYTLAADIQPKVLSWGGGTIMGIADVESYYIPNIPSGFVRVEVIRPMIDKPANASGANLEMLIPDIAEDYVAYRSQPGVLRGLSGTTYFTEYSGAVSIVTPGSSTVREIIEVLSNRVGVSPSELDIDLVGDEIVTGYTVGGLFACAQALKPLQNSHFFDFATYDLKTWAVKRGKPATLDLNDDECLEGSDIDGTEDVQTFPRKLHLSYADPDVGYASTVATVMRSSSDVLVVGEVSPSIPECMNSEKAHKIAEAMLKIAWVDAKGEIRRRVSRRHSKLVPSDVINLVSGSKVRRLRIVDIDRVDGVNELVMRHDRQSAYTSELTGVARPTPTPPPSNIAGPTFFAPLNMPPRSSLEDKLGYYVFGTGILSGWAGYQLDLSKDAGVTFESEGSYSYEAFSGALAAVLPEASPHYLDDTNEILVDLYEGEFESITEVQLFNGENALAISYNDGTAEYVQFQTAELISGIRWRLTNLLRGRRGTISGTHSVGAVVVVVADLTFIEIPDTLIGSTLINRPTSLGEHSDDSSEYALSLAVAHSQRDLAPVDLVLSKSGSTLTVSWTPRWYLGNAMNPLPSVNFLGWRVEVTGVPSTLVNTTALGTNSIAVDTSTLSGPLTVTVAGVNRITGAGAQAQGVI